MADVFDNIQGQLRVREFLRSAVGSGHAAHAYLFSGPAGSNKTVAAFALAKAVLCDNGGCGTCDTCKSVERTRKLGIGGHPDVHCYEPQGTRGYLVEQVRQIITDVSLAPIQADKKVYILNRVDLMSGQAANAFLKTLEEPPDDVVFILLGRTTQSVLSTIVSRCQIVPFRFIPAQEAAMIVAQNTGADLDRCKIAIQAGGGSITKAERFLQSGESQDFRRTVLEGLGRLRQADGYDILEMGREFAQLAKVPAAELTVEQEEQNKINQEFLRKSVLKSIEEQNKRAAGARTFELLALLTSVAASYLRDMLMVCAQTPQLIINVDVKQAISDDAAYTSDPQIVKAFRAIDACNKAIAANAYPETCLDTLLLDMKEELYGTDGTRTTFI